MQAAPSPSDKEISRSSWVGLTFVLLIGCAQLATFAWLDRRPPNDHDLTFMDGVHDNLIIARSDGLAHAVGIQAREGSEGWYPQLGASWMLTWLAVTDGSRGMFRMATLPFLILLIIGTFLASRELSGPRLALLSAWLVATAPLLLCFSRKWVGHYHAAALTPLGLWLGLLLLRSSSQPRTKLWFLFGAWQGLRIYAHPVVLADALLVTALFPLAYWLLKAPEPRTIGRSLLRPWSLALGGMTAALVPILGLTGDSDNSSFSLIDYVARRFDLIGEQPPSGDSNRALETLSSTFLQDGLGWTFIGLLLIPFLSALLLRRGTPIASGRIRSTKLIVVGLAAITVVQLPIALRAIGNDGYGQDWQFLLPRGCILVVWLFGLVQLPRTTIEPLRAAWLVALLGVGLLHSFGPVIASTQGPDPTRQATAWNESFWQPWRESDFGTTADPYNSHLMVTRMDHGGTVIARALQSQGTDRLGILDMTWNIGEPSEWECKRPSPSSSRWELRQPVSEDRAHLAVWPPTLAGLESISLTETTAESKLFIVRTGPDWSGSGGLPESVCANESWTLDEGHWVDDVLEEHFPGVTSTTELWNPNGSIFGLDSRAHCWKQPCPPLRVFLVTR
jgi:hypothetical protein